MKVSPLAVNVTSCPTAGDCGEKVNESAPDPGGTGEPAPTVTISRYEALRSVPKRVSIVRLGRSQLATTGRKFNCDVSERLTSHPRSTPASASESSSSQQSGKSG
mgnify:CR=1 FL=1